jgi:hypothetical protein
MSVQTPIRPDVVDQQLTRADEPAQANHGSAVSSPRQRRLRVDRYGLVAVLVAAGGLAAVIALQWSSSNETPPPVAPLRPKSASISSTPAAPPDRDRWYLDDTPSLVPHATAPVAPPVRDSWYLDTPNTSVSTPADVGVSGPPMRDRWYIDSEFLRL